MIKNRTNLSNERIREFVCPADKNQAFLWDADVRQLAVRATANEAKSFVFEAKLNRKTIRVTLGDATTMPLNSIWAKVGRVKTEELHTGARELARRYKSLVDEGRDPRQVIADKTAADDAARAEVKAKKEAAQIQCCQL